MASTKARLLKHDFPVHGNIFDTFLTIFLGKIDKKAKSRFSERIAGDSSASTELDRPHRKQL